MLTSPEVVVPVLSKVLLDYSNLLLWNDGIDLCFKLGDIGIPLPAVTAALQLAKLEQEITLDALFELWLCMIVVVVVIVFISLALAAEPNDSLNDMKLTEPDEHVWPDCG